MSSSPREVTLRDYFRVFASGKWVLIICAVAVALVALVIVLMRPMNYTAQSLVYMGVATAPSGQPLSTPYTTPVTALKTLREDDILAAAAEASGVPIDRVRDGVAPAVDRVPGAAGGNQPTVATLQYTDRDKATAIRVANAYADAAFERVNGPYTKLIRAWQAQAKNGQARLTQIEGQMDAARRQGAAGQIALVSLQSEYGMLAQRVDAATIGAATMEQYTPKIVSRAETVAASRTTASLIRTTIFGVIIGLILGAIVVLVWKGSPATRDADGT